jgi:hypothetical protein
VAWDEPGAGRSSDLPEGLTLAGFADVLAALIESLRLWPAHVAGLVGRHGGARALPAACRARRDPDHDRHLRRLEGSLPAAEVRARVAGTRRMLAAPPGDFDPTLPGLFAGNPPAELVPLLTAINVDVRPATLGRELAIMAEAI